MPYKSWKCEKMVSMTCPPFILDNYLNWVFLLLREIDCVEFVDINELEKLHEKISLKIVCMKMRLPADI